MQVSEEKSSSTRETRSLINSTKTLVTTTIIVTTSIVPLDEEQCMNQINLEEIYRVKLGPLLVEKYGYWDIINGVTISITEPVLERRRKNALNGLTLEAVVEHSYPNSILHLVK